MPLSLNYEVYVYPASRQSSSGCIVGIMLDLEWVPELLTICLPGPGLSKRQRKEQITATASGMLVHSCTPSSEDRREFQASLNYVAKSCLGKKKGRKEGRRKEGEKIKTATEVMTEVCPKYIKKKNLRRGAF